MRRKDDYEQLFSRQMGSSGRSPQSEAQLECESLEGLTREEVYRRKRGEAWMGRKDYPRDSPERDKIINSEGEKRKELGKWNTPR